ncbi:MAG TPA: hypothetical protein VNI77_09395 [Nitrososphaera sp.]|nr:hypothetical protein [Nitrososphaera sp.]
MAVALDGTVYMVVGYTGRYGLLQNNVGGELFPNTSVIMPVEAGYRTMPLASGTTLG